MIYNTEQLLSHIKALGIKDDDYMVVHTSLKSVGKIDECGKTGAEALIDALRLSVKNGLLAIPSFTYSNIREVPIFDRRNTMPCVGAVPTVAVQLANKAHDIGDNTCIRSFNLSHSVVAFGKDAYEFTKDEVKSDSPMPEFGCYGNLLRQNGKILLIGVGLTSCSFIHYIDARMATTPTEPYPITAIDYDGARYSRFARNAYGPKSSAPSRYYGQYESYLRDAGAVTYGKIGDADTMVCDMRKMSDIITDMHKNGFYLVTEDRK
ncbi:MAG: AAC(3) family N-acetyltransferase [Clostridia bacterium]|nr:AAC(3) family N-acetyltransferase [Clostridia bacterium]